jgi:hypothetical protein
MKLAGMACKKIQTADLMNLHRLRIHQYAVASTRKEHTRSGFSLVSKLPELPKISF